MEKLPEGILKSCKVNLITKESKIKTLSNQCCEFAMVNPIKQGLKARFSWMATAYKKSGNGPLQSIKKFDLLNGNSCYWNAAPYGFVSEPLMIPKVNSKSEDDGWVLVLIWNGKRNKSELVILKAEDLSEQAILELPIGIPHGLHGSWASDN